MAENICYAQIKFLARRPTLKYADIVWNYCTQYKINQIEKKNQLEAARIIKDNVYKMVNALTPIYFRSLIPATVANTSAYQLCDTESIRPLITRT